jgi:hypothetical protein
MVAVYNAVTQLNGRNHAPGLGGGSDSGSKLTE